MGQKIDDSGTGGPADSPRKKPAKVASAVIGKKAVRTQIDLRLTKPEKEKLRVYAARAGLSLTGYILAATRRPFGTTDELEGVPDFTEPPDLASDGNTRKPNTPTSQSHESNLKHLLSWAQILDENGVNTGALRESLKRHLALAASDRLWQSEARKLGRELVLASKLGTHTPVLQEMADTLTQKLRQH